MILIHYPQYPPSTAMQLLLCKTSFIPAVGLLSKFSPILAEQILLRNTSLWVKYLSYCYIFHPTTWDLLKTQAVSDTSLSISPSPLYLFLNTSYTEWRCFPGTLPQPWHISIRTFCCQKGCNTSIPADTTFTRRLPVLSCPAPAICTPEGVTLNDNLQHSAVLREKGCSGSPSMAGGWHLRPCCATHHSSPQPPEAEQQLCGTLCSQCWVMPSPCSGKHEAQRIEALLKSMPKTHLKTHQVTNLLAMYLACPLSPHRAASPCLCGCTSPTFTSFPSARHPMTLPLISISPPFSPLQICYCTQTAEKVEETRHEDSLKAAPALRCPR